MNLFEQQTLYYNVLFTYKLTVKYYTILYRMNNPQHRTIETVPYDPARHYDKEREDKE